MYEADEVSCMTGLELRVQVTQYVTDKVAALRVNPANIDPDAEEVEEDGPATKKVKLETSAANASAVSKLAPPPGYAYENVSVLRCNAMKFLSNFFDKAQVSVVCLLL